ncbi:MAG: DUF305 domain-containing protein [Aquisalinus sp.]|nr:DUF305 domain-containing protein [Aquisalinus sp.]
MRRLNKHDIKYTIGSTIALAMLACASGASAQDVPIIQPGAPGEPGRALSAEEAARVADTRYTEDDVRFMQDMIPHHYQAVEMAALVSDRTNRAEIVDLAGRIDASQEDEIEFMQTWLRDRGEDAPDPAKQHHGGSGHHHHHHKTHMDHAMMGMATPEQMEQLAALEGAAFDKLFLELMIPHHEGAVRMSQDLLSKRGSAYDPVLYDFVNDVINDQNAEITRMTALLASLSEDPRVDLAAGFRDAGEAISNLELVATLPKPQGFFDPENPVGLPPIIDPDEDEAEDEETATEWGARSPLLSFSNTDMAFFDDNLIVGNYHGFNIYKLDAEGVPELKSSVVCPGGQGDVSVVGDLLIMSVEQTRGRVDCGQQGVPEDVSAERFRGLRIFDISDLSQPVQVGQVQTCRGSHTHSVVSGPGRDGKIVVYNSGTASVRDEEELAGCIGDIPGDDRTALFRIDVIEIPVDDPSKARIVDSPAVFADSETGALAGLWRGGDHGDDTQDTNRTDQCHDITVFPSAKIAAGACSGNGIIFDISNPLKPRRIDAVVDKGFAYWHSATFNNDGTKVLFTDEWGGGGRPRCRVHDPMDWGANALYDIEDGKLEFRSHYKLPAPQSDKENCVAHNGSIVPVPGRDIFVQAWYQGGLSLIDFTDSSNPFEIGFFDRGPVHPERMMVGGFWSTYWYNGRIYGTEIIRGLDVLALKPSDYLSENEIAAAALADQGAVFNPQQQLPVTWPAVPVVAHAYLDQLERGNNLSADRLAELRVLVDTVEAGLASEERNTTLARDVRQTARDLRREDAAGEAAKRLAALADTLQEMADNLR